MFVNILLDIPKILSSHGLLNTILIYIGKFWKKISGFNFMA